MRKKIGKSYLNDCIGLWNSVDEIDFEALLREFALKPTNGSGDVVICKDKEKCDWDEAKKTLSMHTASHFANKTKEWVYCGLPYRIIGERLIKSSDENQIKDYKFFCFHGEPKFLFVASERGTEHLKFDFYDTNWQRLPIKNAHENSAGIQKPEHFDEMLRVAAKLSEDFPHVRVDLYEEEGKVQKRL